MQLDKDVVAAESRIRAACRVALIVVAPRVQQALLALAAGLVASAALAQSPFQFEPIQPRAFNLLPAAELATLDALGSDHSPTTDGVTRIPVVVAPNDPAAPAGGAMFAGWDESPLGADAGIDPWVTLAAYAPRSSDSNDSRSSDRDNRSTRTSDRDTDKDRDGKKDDIAKGGILGKAPENNALQFLRRQAVLLAPGKRQLDVGVSYSILDDRLPVPIIDNGEVVDVLLARIRQRLLVTPMELRWGITKRMQWFINAPVGWADTELAFPGFDDFNNVGGIGDTMTGISYLLQHGKGNQPDIIGTLAVLAPTGNFGLLIINSQNPSAALGGGFWAITANLLVVHNLDPVTLFYGAGYFHRFDRVVDGSRFNPGESVNYQLGAGFAVSPRVTLSAAFLGAYFQELYIDGERLQGSIIEPLRMRFAITMASKKKIIEPFAEIPMTYQAPARIGLTLTY